jgi:hypothetical protein
MGLQKLLDNQIITIDDHKRGAREIKNWDDPSIDVHIEKITKYKIDGDTHDVIIKISINNFRPLVTIIPKNKKNEIPRKLMKEITLALFDIGLLTKFIQDLVKILRNYESIFNDVEKAKQALSMLSKHFNLKWTEVQIEKTVNDVVSSYTAICSNKSLKSYFIKLEKHKITLGDISSKSKIN